MTGRRDIDPPPAPVVTPAGTYGELPRRPYGEPEPERGASLAQVATLLLAFGIGAWLLALSAAHATSREVATAALERSITALADVEALLLLHEDGIRAEAEGAEPGAGVQVPGFPISSATLTVEEARDGEREEWRASLLATAAAAVYEQGIEAFEPGGEVIDGGTLSTSGGVRRLIALIAEEHHGPATTAAQWLGGAVVLLAAIVLWRGDGARRFVAVGLALFGGAILAALGGLAVTALVHVVGYAESQTAEEVSGIARALAWLPVEQAIPVAAAGLAIAVPAMLVAYLQRPGRGRSYEPAFED